jgi:hypothetical protein
MPTMNCKNCHKPMSEQAEFCPACGQSVKVISRPWRDAVGELVTELFDFDGRMLRSLRLLLTRPGFLAYEYINDRRLSYTSPVRMYLVISLVFFFVLPLILPELRVAGPTQEVSVNQYSQAMFVLLPVFALLLKIFYRQTYYLSHLVFVVYLFSAMYIVFAAILSLETTADVYISVMILQVVFLAYMLAYFMIALRVTYQQGWLKTTLKCLALVLIFSTIIAGAIELASHLDFGLLSTQPVLTRYQ